MLSRSCVASVTVWLLGAHFTAGAIPRDHHRIVGGYAVDIEAHPYQVSVQELDVHICGGSVVHSRWILTAGHCVDDTIPRYVTVRAGSAYHNRSGTVHNVMSFFVHPDHIPYTWEHDLALLELEVALAFTATVQSIPLAASEEDLNFTGQCYVTGWGRTLHEDECTDRLRAADVPLIAPDVCYHAYEGRTDDSMVCAGDLEHGGRGSCTYDSGGPLSCDGLLVGVTSWGKGCALPGYPDVYASVLFAKHWIESVITA